MNALAMLTVVLPLSTGSVDVLEALRGVAGTWEGDLEYRDYRSDQRVKLPARLTCETPAIGPYLVQRLEFDDPGHTVVSTQVMAVDVSGRQVSLLTDEGTEQFEIVEQTTESANAWTIVLETRGSDDNQPAGIRQTLRLADGELAVTKQVRPVGTDAAWQFRSRMRLTRTPAPVPDTQTLVGTWQVDLRPTPDGDPYYQPFEVESVIGRSITGTFYGTPIENGRIDTTWGAVRFAFTTEDGSGVYHTSGVLRDGRLEGTTHSLGRGFLSVWSAEPTP